MKVNGHQALCCFVTIGLRFGYCMQTPLLCSWLHREEHHTCSLLECASSFLCSSMPLASHQLLLLLLLTRH